MCKYTCRLYVEMEVCTNYSTKTTCRDYCVWTEVLACKQLVLQATEHGDTAHRSTLVDHSLQPKTM